MTRIWTNKERVSSSPVWYYKRFLLNVLLLATAIRRAILKVKSVWNPCIQQITCCPLFGSAIVPKQSTADLSKNKSRFKKVLLNKYSYKIYSNSLTWNYPARIFYRNTFLYKKTITELPQFGKIWGPNLLPVGWHSLVPFWGDKILSFSCREIVISFIYI